MFSGNTILGDGSVIMIIDPNGVAQAVGIGRRRRRQATEAERDGERQAEAATESLLVFRAGSPQPKAVPLSLVTRLEEIDAKKIELSNGRHAGAVPRPAHAARPRSTTRCASRPSGAQPLLVFSDDDRSHGAGGRRDRRHRRGPARHRGRRATRPGVLGSAVIKGQATEIIDVGHFLPLAFEDWLQLARSARARQAARTRAAGRRLAFFRNMLAPVLKAAGYAVDRGVGAPTRWRCCKAAGASTSSSPTSRCRAWTASSSPRRCAPIRAPPTCRSSRLSSLRLGRGDRARHAQVGFHDYVAKFDRQGLIAALKEQTAELELRGMRRRGHDRDAARAPSNTSPP